MTRELTRIGIDLGVLDAKKVVAPMVPNCPGARVRITRYDFDTFVQGGERFVSARQDIPHDGYGDGRIRCDQPVGKLPKTASNDVLYYGLCFSCAALEVRNRDDLRERARVKEQQR